MNQDRLYSVGASAVYLGGVSKHSVYAWLSKGILARTKIGRRTMIRESELIRFIERGNK
jgi:excisionase family DNA binding protein